MARLYLFGPRCVVREALQALLTQAGHTVVGADGDAAEARAELATLPAELLLADLRWGVAPVARLLDGLADLPHPPRCLLLQAERHLDSDLPVRQLPTSLVWHWLAPEVDRLTLLAALDSVQQHRRGAPPWLQPGQVPGPVLSALERRVLRDSALGLSASTIGRALSLPARSVSHCRREAMARLALTDLASLARWALRQGWIDARGPATPAG